MTAPGSTRRQFGMTLVELMIALTLSLVVLLAATAMLMSTSSLYRSEDEIGRLQDGGRMSIELISRLVRQTEYENWDKANGAIVNSMAFLEKNGFRLSPAITGANDVRVDSDHPTDSTRDKPGGVNGSDAIRLRYFGASKPDAVDEADDSIVDCAGNGIRGPQEIETAEEDRGTSVLYVARDAGGEPNLYCGFKGETGWASEPLVKGIESLQILYGLDTGVQDSYPNIYVPANQITDDMTWRRVVAVKVSLLARSDKAVSAADPAEQFNLFGSAYGGAKDPGTVIKVASLQSGVRGRLRKVYTTTVFLRNQVIH